MLPIRIAMCSPGWLCVCVCVCVGYIASISLLHRAAVVKEEKEIHSQADTKKSWKVLFSCLNIIMWMRRKCCSALEAAPHYVHIESNPLFIIYNSNRSKIFCLSFYIVAGAERVLRSLVK